LPLPRVKGMELRVSEIFRSVQGEGPSTGAQAIFLRLAVCNLRCVWCDTRYSWDFDRFAYEEEVSHMTVRAAAAAMLGRAAEAADPLLGAHRLIVTGGEPLLQQAGLIALFSELSKNAIIEVETNGTIEPRAELRVRVAQWNVSPKLSNSGDTLRQRVRKGALIALRDTGRAWLKLVVKSAADFDEAEALVAATAWPAARVLLMPEAASRVELATRGPAVSLAARTRGYGYSTRLQIERWDGRRGL
jgi:7-carboxy-7-deazaguanine synthase